MTIRAVPPGSGHLGQGISFPLSLDGKGRLALSSGPQSVVDALTSIVRTQRGERVMQFDYGAGDFVHEPLDAARMELQLRECIAQHEARVSAVSGFDLTSTNNPGEVILTLPYELAGEATARTLTFPFATGLPASAVNE